MVLGVNMKKIEIIKSFGWFKSVSERVALKPGEIVELDEKKADSWIKAGLAVEKTKTYDPSEIKKSEKQAPDAEENKLGKDGEENKAKKRRKKAK
jgi:hypothetical protein